MQWAYGVTCWEVFNGGKNPYPGMSAYTVAEMIDSGERLQKPSNIACSDEMYGKTLHFGIELMFTFIQI